MSKPRLAGVLLFALAGVCTAQEGPSTVLVRQADAIVTLDDVDTFAAGIPEAQRPAFFSSPVRVQGMLANLLTQKQLAAKARQEALDKDPMVQRQVALVVEKALAEAQVQNFRKNIKTPDFSKLAQEEFLAHKSKYAIKGQLEVKHVLISTKSRSEADARALADDVLKQAKAHPDQFDALIEKYSEDPDKASNHGLVSGSATESRYTAPFANAAKALKQPGDLAPVTKTPYGFHVIQLVLSTPDQPQTFAQVGPEIIARLKSEYVEKSVKDYTDGLRNQKLDTNRDLVDSLRTRYGAVTMPPTKDAEAGATKQ
ncbi:peptidylprolyl isomerase [Dokdonella sp.]|uniref:peptidylprolyl isomerase n=1 Tax=Dokdonella sp. TaxID=2291710 RepID=UPI001B24AB81|nr:peptidylprolyl isomerase [Dokdonella sp.]MBO9665104.1 peptidylprolyl isomerase [Dokdonella sp.]